MRILLVEDDSSVSGFIVKGLREEQYAVDLATDGEMGLAMAETTPYDVIILDVMLPKLNGFEVCRRIRLEDDSVPILFLSAKSEERDVVAGLRLGADDFIRKPFGKAELLARLHAALRRAEPQQQAAESFAFGPWRVIPGSLRAEQGSASIDLTPREVSLLQFFAKHAGQALTRDALLDACWGIDYFPESRTLDQHIATLRKKIDTDSTRPSLIETLRGTGYRYL